MSTIVLTNKISEVAMSSLSYDVVSDDQVSITIEVKSVQGKRPTHHTATQIVSRDTARNHYTKATGQGYTRQLETN